MFYINTCCTIGHFYSTLVCTDLSVKKKYCNYSQLSESITLNCIVYK